MMMTIVRLLFIRICDALNFQYEHFHFLFTYDTIFVNIDLEVLFIELFLRRTVYAKIALNELPCFILTDGLIIISIISLPDMIKHVRDRKRLVQSYFGCDANCFRGVIVHEV